MVSVRANSRALTSTAFLSVLLLSDLCCRVSTLPSIALPVNAQLPSVARVAEPFQFVFSNSTFATSTSAINYEISAAPEWLHLDRQNRTFLGTPGTMDIGTASFQLLASDDSGTTVMPITFVVSGDQGPEASDSVAGQLKGFGTLSNPDTLLLYPSSSLSFSFNSNTFLNTTDRTAYYAICGNNTPLPSWLQFNPQGLTFTGQTPQFTSPNELPQQFDIRLIASNIVGFTEAVVSFSIVIESHQLTFGTGPVILNVTNQDSVRFTGLRDALRVDGNPANLSSLKSVTAAPPQWLDLNKMSLELSGTPPDRLSTSNFRVSVEDVNGNFAETTVLIMNGSSSLVFGTVGPLNAVVGSQFTYTIDRSIFSPPETTAEINVGNSSSWLSFDSNTFTLSGTVPSDMLPQNDTLRLVASYGSTTDIQDIELRIETPEQASKTQSGNGPPFPPTGAASSSSTTSPNSAPLGVDGIENRRLLAAAIVLPIVVALALLLVYFILRRRRHRLREATMKTEKLEYLRPDALLDASENQVDPKRSSRPRSNANNWRWLNPPQVEIRSSFISRSGQVPPNTDAIERSAQNPQQRPNRDSHNSFVERLMSLIQYPRPEPPAPLEFTIPRNEIQSPDTTKPALPPKSVSCLRNAQAVGQERSMGRRFRTMSYPASPSGFGHGSGFNELSIHRSLNGYSRRFSSGGFPPRSSLGKHSRLDMDSRRLKASGLSEPNRGFPREDSGEWATVSEHTSGSTFRNVSPDVKNTTDLTRTSDHRLQCEQTIRMVVEALETSRSRQNGRWHNNVPSAEDDGPSIFNFGISSRSSSSAEKPFRRTSLAGSDREGSLPPRSLYRMPGSLSFARNRASAQRKGRMMQRSISISSSQKDRSGRSKVPRVSGQPPLSCTFRSSITSSLRFEDAAGEEYAQLDNSGSGTMQKDERHLATGTRAANSTKPRSFAESVSDFSSDAFSQQWSSREGHQEPTLGEVQRRTIHIETPVGGSGSSQENRSLQGETAFI